MINLSLVRKVRKLQKQSEFYKKKANDFMNELQQKKAELAHLFKENEIMAKNLSNQEEEVQL